MHRAWVDRVLFSRCKIFMRDDSAGEEEEMKIVRGESDGGRANNETNETMTSGPTETPSVTAEW